MKLVFGECFMYSTLFMAHKLSRVWSLKVKVYFGKGIRVTTLTYSFILMPDLQMTNKTCRFVIYVMNLRNWIMMTTVMPQVHDVWKQCKHVIRTVEVLYI